MATSRSMAPAAILVGTAMIGVGVYFGLRPTPTATSSTASAQPLPTSAARPSTVAVTLTATELQRRTTLALANHRAHLVSACWQPAVVAQAKPATARFTFNFTFDATGRQLGRGVVEDRRTSRPEVTACVLAELPPLEVGPLGHRMATEVLFELPSAAPPDRGGPADD